jgi:hypothetical protein
MKNKFVSFTIVFAFLACIICTPIHIFLQSFYKSSISFENIDLKGVSKNIIFSAEKIALFDDFTQNIKTPMKKVFDFSGVFALLSKVEKQKFILEANWGGFDFFKIPALLNAFALEDADRHRLRMHCNTDFSILFTFFILIYIGMLKAVYSNKSILILNNEKPLFA